MYLYRNDINVYAEVPTKRRRGIPERRKRWRTLSCNERTDNNRDCFVWEFNMNN